MPNITFSVSDELYKRMKNYPEIKWSTLYRQMIKQYLDKFKEPTNMNITDLRDQLRKKGITMDDLTHEQILKSYKKMRELEWERVYSIRTG